MTCPNCESKRTAWFQGDRECGVKEGWECLDCGEAWDDEPEDQDDKDLARAEERDMRNTLL